MHVAPNWRDRDRTVWMVDEGVVRDLHRLLAATGDKPDGLVVDTADVGPDEAADRILKRSA